MNSAATEQLPYEHATELDEERVPSAEKKWSRRQTAWFVLGTCAFLWTLIFLAVRSLF